MPENPHPKWKQDRCEHCRAGMPMRNRSGCSHFVADQMVWALRYPLCTAPTPEQYIAELEAKLADEERDSWNFLNTLDAILDCPLSQPMSLGLLVEVTARQRMTERDQARAALKVATDALGKIAVKFDSEVIGKPEGNCDCFYCLASTALSTEAVAAEVARAAGADG